MYAFVGFVVLVIVLAYSTAPSRNLDVVSWVVLAAAVVALPWLAWSARAMGVYETPNGINWRAGMSRRNWMSGEAEWIAIRSVSYGRGRLSGTVVLELVDGRHRIVYGGRRMMRWKEGSTGDFAGLLADHARAFAAVSEHAASARIDAAQPPPPRPINPLLRLVLANRPRNDATPIEQVRWLRRVSYTRLAPLALVFCGAVAATHLYLVAAVAGGSVIVHLAGISALYRHVKHAQPDSTRDTTDA